MDAAEADAYVENPGVGAMDRIIARVFYGQQPLAFGTASATAPADSSVLGKRRLEDT